MRPGAAALAFRLALRELRGGIKGFYVFLACLALGVAAIAGVGSVSRALSDGLAGQGRVILGGDVSVRLLHRRADAAELTFLNARGAVSEIATLRAMARKGDLSDQTLVELKAVDAAYPLYGEVALRDGARLGGMLGAKAGIYGAAVEDTLLARLDLSVGDTIKVGDATVRINAAIAREPDRLSAGLSFGPRLLVSAEALRATGLVRPGSLVYWHYRVRLPERARTDSDLEAFAADAAAEMPESGWRIRDRAHASPSLQTAIDRFTQLLSLVGLTALIVGGVGVANAVRGHLETKRTTIAILKCLGAPARALFLVYLFEIGMIAAGGIVIGLALGAALPLVAGPLLTGLVPLPIETGVHAAPLLLAAVYGILISLAFALWPLAVARDTPAAALFREQVAPARRRPRFGVIAAIAASVGALAATALATASEPRIALIYIGLVAAAIVLLRLVAAAVMMAAARAPRASRATLRLALGNIHRPGALTPSVVLSLGLGLSLLVTLALIDRNLTRELTASIPETAPSFFFVDIERGETDAFTAMLSRQAPDGDFDAVPMLRGRLVSLDGVPVSEIDPSADARWVLHSDRGVTYSETLPEGSRLVAGNWWDEGHDGEPLVSFVADLARSLNLDIGSKVTVNVLGRDVTARIANLREVDWGSLGINFVMVFSPNTFAGAPHMMLATLTLPEAAGSARETALMAEVARNYPHVTAVRVKEALDTASGYVRQILWAIRGASSITIVASLLVLAGALAAGHRARLREAAILKILGATRRRLINTFAIEFLALAVATAAFATLAGAVSAWIVLTFVMRAHFSFAPDVALGTAAGSALLMILLGLAANWRLLGQKPAPVLRNL